LIARSHFEASLHEGHEGLVLAEGEYGLEQEDLGVTQLGVDLSFSPGRDLRFKDGALTNGHMTVRLTTFKRIDGVKRIPCTVKRLFELDHRPSNSLGYEPIIA